MKRIITSIFILCISSIFQVHAEALYPSISGPGIDPFSYVKVGQECTYIVRYSTGAGSSTTNRLIRWDIDQNDYDFVRSDPSNASITIKWKRAGTRCRIRAYNIAIIGYNGQITYEERTATVKVQSASIGDVILTGPDKALAYTNIQIGAEIRNTLANLSINISGNDLSASNWVSTGENIGYFPVSFRAPGIKTVTVTVSGSGLTSKSATKTVTVYPNIITGEDAIASDSQETYKLVNAPAGTTYTWSVSSGLQIISGQGSSQVVVKSTTYMGSGYVEASFSGFTIRKNIAIGVPNADKIEAEFGTNNTLYSYHTNRNECRAYYSGPGTILEFGWEAFDWEVYNPRTPNKSIIFLKAINPGCCSTVNVLLRARNSAGWGKPVLLGAQVNNSTSRQYNIQYSTDILTISENTEEINADINQSGLKRKNDDPLVYELYNINNVSLAKKGTINRTGGTIDISDLPQGIYAISLIIDSSTKQTMKIAIK